jgi:hypothetical protein
VRKLDCMCSVSLLVCFAVCAMAQNRTFVGTWKLDASQSDLGRDPAPQSLTCTILKDSPEFASWRCRPVDQNGKLISYSWSGPEDGSLHPLKDPTGKVLAMESMKKQSDGTILRHGEDSSDGSSVDAVLKVSADGSTLTEEPTEKRKDGTETKQKSVLHRAAKAASGASTSQDVAPTAKSDEAILRQIESDWGDAVLKKDIKKLDQILADDWVGRFPFYVLNKAQELNLIKSGAIKVYSEVTSDLSVRLFENVAVITGRDDDKVSFNGRDVSGRYLWMDVFVKRSGHWRAVASEETLLMDK